MALQAYDLIECNCSLENRWILVIYLFIETLNVISNPICQLQLPTAVTHIVFHNANQVEPETAHRHSSLDGQCLPFWTGKINPIPLFSALDQPPCKLTHMTAETMSRANTLLTIEFGIHLVWHSTDNSSHHIRSVYLHSRSKWSVHKVA